MALCAIHYNVRFNRLERKLAMSKKHSVLKDNNWVKPARSAKPILSTSTLLMDGLAGGQSIYGVYCSNRRK